MSELLRVPAVFIQLFVVVYLIIKSGIIDVQLVWVDPDDWSCRHSALVLALNQVSYRIVHASVGSPTGTVPL